MRGEHSTGEFLSVFKSNTLPNSDFLEIKSSTLQKKSYEISKSP